MDLSLSALWIFEGSQNLQANSIWKTLFGEFFSSCEAIAKKPKKPKTNKKN